jgi:hypothetical protein
MERPAPFISVIIPVFNDCGSLRTCLEALARQTYPATAYEVIDAPQLRRRMACQGRVFVEQHHDIDGLNDRLVEVYEELLKP